MPSRFFTLSPPPKLFLHSYGRYYSGNMVGILVKITMIQNGDLDYKMTTTKLSLSGTLNRTTAATNLNATSSRSHMLIRVAFKQIFLNDVGESTTKSSEINLVDLAGRELRIACVWSVRLYIAYSCLQRCPCLSEVHIRYINFAVWDRTRLVCY